MEIPELAKRTWEYLIAPPLLKGIQALFGKVTEPIWKYLHALAKAKVDEQADPRIQIEQAITEAKRQHELLSQQAAAVLGNRRQLELKLSRSIEGVEKLQGSARQALMLADESTRAGDVAKAPSYEEAAQAFAMKLIAAEASMKDLKSLHDQAVGSAQAARKAVEQNALALQKKLFERAKLLSQLEHTKTQERMNEALASLSELTPPGEIPTLAQVQGKIEARYARALGQAELASDSVEARMLEIEKAALDAQAARRLETMRASLGLGTTARPTSEGSHPQLEKGSKQE